MRGSLKWSLLRLAFLVLIASAPAAAEGSIPRRDSTTCIVLSVGGPKGLAHIGAIDAIKKSGIRVDYVFGNSMGAVVGALYSSDPNSDMSDMYRVSFDSYQEMTRGDATRRAIIGGVASAFATGGVSLIGTLAGGFLGANSTELLDADRFQKALDWYYEARTFESLELNFATSYYEVVKSSPVLRIRTTGNIAEAIRRSANNPLIFKFTDLQYIDPGVDRVSATPIQEAFELFHPDRIIAINVTGQPAFYDRAIPCEVNEIIFASLPDDSRALLGRGDPFEDLYNIGFQKTATALKRAGFAPVGNNAVYEPRPLSVHAAYAPYVGKVSVFANGYEVIAHNLSPYHTNTTLTANYRGYKFSAAISGNRRYGGVKCIVSVNDQEVENREWQPR